jgi:hypothetical protein
VEKIERQRPSRRKRLQANVRARLHRLAGLPQSSIILERAVDVDAPKPSIGLWGLPFDWHSGFATATAVDFDPAKAGLEAIGLNSSCSWTRIGGTLRTTRKLRIGLKFPINETQVNFPTLTLNSGTFPDPAPSSATWNEYFDEGMNLLNGERGLNPNYAHQGATVITGCQSFPRTQRFGIGVATGAGGVRVVAIGYANAQ